MEVQAAQKEMRSVYLGGAVGQAVSGLLWLISAVLGTFATPIYGIYALVLGGMMIFPLTQLGLRLMGRPASVRPENPLNGLAMQVAFTVPLAIPVIGAAALYNVNWFYPAFMIIVGAHYLPFIFLYGMRHFAVLAAVLIGGGVALGFMLPRAFSPGGWLTAAVLLLFALVIWVTGAAKQ
jgi:hypothetical protein